MIGSVWNWLGISKEDFDILVKEKKNKCLKCDKNVSPYTPFCTWHLGAFHRWRNKLIEEGKI